MTAWNRISEIDPPIGKKLIALFSDGSGATMFFRHDGGYIDSEGDEFGALGAYDLWTLLPQEMEFWCEVRSEDPMSLWTPPNPSPPLTPRPQD